ncbi:Uncharacterised protein [[Clostridium] sordellii]|uniref:hypothetical protein n=1 Tax=Paraclostridium sordellii TaxID=1505 RepID=UPI0005E4920A|nr:hypothetical protein [Paeniclostridium sordellii]CEQ06505.1 Uncharacterised protein [[Clostridium] sordellii] [Paeniclostridium sordellii]
MKYIGIRVTSNDIYYSIIEGKESNYDVISISNIKIPKALEVPERLSYVRNLLITIIDQYSIKYAAIRVIEGSAMGKVNGSILFRVNLEGVIQEVFAGSSIKEYILARNLNISSILNTGSRVIKDIATDLKLKDKFKTDSEKVLNEESRESLVVAIAMFKKKEAC